MIKCPLLSLFKLWTSNLTFFCLRSRKSIMPQSKALLCLKKKNTHNQIHMSFVFVFVVTSIDRNVVK